MYLVGFDIGGSSVEAVLLGNRELVKSKKSEKTPQNWLGLLKLLKKVKNDFSDKITPQKIKSVGICIPLPLDLKQEKVTAKHKLAYLYGKNLKNIFSLELQCPVAVAHDSHCFLAAEKKIGQGKKFKNVFYLTLGTGIGGSFMINNEIIFGAHGSAGEAGHTILDISQGWNFEKLAAREFFVRELRKDFLSAEAKAREGDKKCLAAFKKYGANLGAGVANIINIFDPGTVILGGGIITARKFFERTMRDSAKKYILSSEARKTSILFSKLGRFGGALGAALLTQNQISNSAPSPKRYGASATKIKYAKQN